MGLVLQLRYMLFRREVQTAAGHRAVAELLPSRVETVLSRQNSGLPSLRVTKALADIGCCTTVADWRNSP